MKETISIIIPVYNVEKYIVKCLDSVANQTYKGPIECLLIDDKGSDNSIRVVRQYISEYTGSVQFKIISHAENCGLSAARNTGLNNANGEYIYFLDSDDFIDPETLTELYTALNSNNAAIAIGYFTTYNEGVDSIYRKDWLFNNSRIIESFEFVETMLTEKSNYASTAKLYKREIIEDVRFRVGKRNEDTLFIFDIRKNIETNKYNCVDVPIYSYHYRVVDGSISHTSSRPLAIDIIDNYDIILRECGDRNELTFWIKNKQLQLLMGLIYEIVLSKLFSYADYKIYTDKLSTFPSVFAASCLSERGFRNYRMLVNYPFFYWCIQKTKSYFKHG